MSDLISKQEVIKAIDRFIPADPMMSDYTQGISVGLAIATRCVEQFSQENHDSSQGLVKDLISRQDVLHELDGCDYELKDWQRWKLKTMVRDIPSAEPERLTDDDFETIRIHLNAYKEKLCNQQRWEEAEEYQRIIDRFMAFASAQPEIIRCGQCKYAEAADSEDNQDGYTCQFHRGSIWFSGSYCSWAERREECTP